ncbi:NUDIX domain-containing protein [Candidatus Woesearchaeota archaeon]|nr:NUDIX domain-containing protein [Candidatus Woesearchaeota archaeon]
MAHDEKVDIVDSEDRVIGEDTKERCHLSGKRHRCAAIYVMNEGKLFLQIRADHKKVEPGKMDHSAAGHVKKGENYEDAAVRELEEELGIKTNLTFLGKAAENKTHTDGRDIKHIFQMYIAEHDGAIKLNKDELKGIALIEPEEIEKMIKEKPSQFAQGFLETFPTFIEWYREFGNLP